MVPVRQKKLKIILSILITTVSFLLFTGGKMLFNENYIDENVFLLSFACTSFEQWESNFPYFLNKIRTWKSCNRNQFLLKCYFRFKMDGGCYLPYIDNIYKYNYEDFFLWLKDYPQNTKEKNRIEILLLLHDDYLYTIKEIPPR